MPAGQQPTVAGLNGQLTAMALQLRDVCHNIQCLNMQLADLGVDGIVNLGTDTATAQDMVDKSAIINTVSAIYYGAATQSPAYNFNDALSSLWAGQ